MGFIEFRKKILFALNAAKIRARAACIRGGAFCIGTQNAERQTQGRGSLMSGVRLAVSMILLSVFARTETATPRQLNQELQAGTGQTPAPAVVDRMVTHAQLQLEQHGYSDAERIVKRVLASYKATPNRTKPLEEVLDWSEKDYLREGQHAK